MTKMYRPGVEVLFLARAGLFRVCALLCVENGAIPRTRGVVPDREMFGLIGDQYSPHTQGCSLHCPSTPHNHSVFPAYSGLFRSLLSSNLTA